MTDTCATPSDQPALLTGLEVGLSHMGQDGEKVVVVPSSLEHFVARSRGTRRGLQSIDGKFANYGEIFQSMVLAAPASVLVDAELQLAETPTLI